MVECCFSCHVGSRTGNNHGGWVEEAENLMYFRGKILLKILGNVVINKFSVVDDRYGINTDIDKVSEVS